MGKFTVLLSWLATMSAFQNVGMLESTEFRSIACKNYEDTTVVMFSNNSGERRRIAFMRGIRAIAVETEAMKGIIDWKNIKSIFIEGESYKYEAKLYTPISMDYVAYDGTQQSISFGEIDDHCLDNIKARISNSLEFRSR